MSEQKKPRKPRAKKVPPTKEEMLKVIIDGEKQLKVALSKLEEERPKLNGIGVPTIIDLVANELEELKQDLEDLEESKKEINEMEEVKN